MGNYYRMELKVPANLVTTIFDLLKDDGLVVNVQPIQGEPAKRVPKYKNGVKNKGITGEELIIDALHSGPQNYQALCKTFVLRGFSETSVSPTCSRLIQANKIAKNVEGYFEIV